MELTVGIILYLFVIGLFIALGRFLKECDTEAKNSCINDAKNISLHHHLLR